MTCPTSTLSAPMVVYHVVLLHGEVSSSQDVDELERAVMAVSGVTGVESYLHVGLTSGDTRPSAGRSVHPPSAALRRLLDTAIGAGVDPGRRNGWYAASWPPSPTASPSASGVTSPSISPSTCDQRPPRRDGPGAQRRLAPCTAAIVAGLAATTGELPRDKAQRMTPAVIEVLAGAGARGGGGGDVRRPLAPAGAPPARQGHAIG